MRESAAGRRAEIDGLRAVAIALVIGFHVVPGQLPGGFVGVDVFFVLSGFLITRLLAADNAPGRWRRFYELRLRRLAPALVLVLAATLALGWWLLLHDALRRLARHTLAATLFVANIAFWRESGYFDTGALQKPLLHLWSLGIEEQFYLIWPGLFWWAARRGGRARRMTGLFGATSLVACLLVAKASPEAAFYLPWFRFWELLAGAMLALTPSNARPLARWSDLGCAAGAALLLASAVAIDPRDPYPSWSALAPVAGTALLLWGSAGSEWTRRALSWPPFVGLGLISYPLYLWHWPLLSLQAELHASPSPAQKSQAILLALLLSIATYLGVERPVRASYRERPSATVAVLSLAIVLLVAGGTWILGRPQPSTPVGNARIVRVERALGLDAQLRRGTVLRPCSADAALSSLVGPYCSAAGTNPGAPSILLWGDSTAVSWAPLVHAVAAARGRSSVVLSISGCPPLLGVRSPRFDGCALADSAWKLELIERLRPTRIVLTARWAAYVNEVAAGDRAPAHFVSDDLEGPVDLATSRAAVNRQLPATLDRLAAIAPVVVIAAPPDLRLDLPRALVRGLEYRTPLTEHRAAQEPVMRVLRKAASADRRITVLDPASRLCAEALCTGVVGDVVVYTDDNHVTAQGALLFRDELSRLLGGARP